MENLKMKQICEQCVCAPVCETFRTTGGIAQCVYFYEKPVRAKWIRECRNRVYCSNCRKGFNTDVRQPERFCGNCGREMELKLTDDEIFGLESEHI